MMEYCPLGSVQDVMVRMGKCGHRLKEDDIVYILKSVVAGLAYLHGERIVHR